MSSARNKRLDLIKTSASILRIPFLKYLNEIEAVLLLHIITWN